MIRCNISELQRMVRGLIALPIISWGYYYRHMSEQWSLIIFWGGMYLAFTAAVAWCPARLLMSFLKRSAQKMLVLVILLSGLGSSSARADEFWSTWGDGKAEMSGYDLVQPRYGENRKGKAVLIFVTEDHSLKERVKIEGNVANVPASERFPVLKLNSVREFQTGVYDYKTLTSVFARIDRAMQLSKVSTSVQEWCGHVYHQFLLKGTHIEETLHSYFGGEADQVQRHSFKNGAVFEDNIPILIRELQGLWLKPGETRTLPCAPSLLALRFLHQPFEWKTLTITKADKTETIPSVLGKIQVVRWTVITPASGTFVYDVEARWPHRIIRWSSDQGESAVLRGTTRLPYWKLHDNGDETYLKELGF